ncbi:MAG: leucyl aminopeptidase [Actinomycetota bacterium]|nr:MAG: leucyl aminopeptidase [Actinomycetota bacterium]
MPTLAVSAADAASLRVDAYVVGIHGDGSGAVTLAAPYAGLTAAGRRRLLAAVAAVGAKPAVGEVTRLPGEGITAAPLVVATGLGPAPGGRRGVELETLRRGAGAATRALAGIRRVGLSLPARTAEEVEAVAQGGALGAYSFTTFRADTASAVPPPVRAITVVVADARARELRSAVSHAQAVTDAVHLARDLVNTPPSHLHPVELAAAAVAAAEGLPLQVEVLDQRALARAGFGGILAVGQGSANPPRLVRLAYRHPKATRHLALIGKGITFDSGGLSLKPPAGMEWMKADMGGAAAVVGAMKAIATLGLQVNVTGWVPSAENMPSGTAQRPSDVITIYGGRTVEVLNTDAEGRLILADALVRAAEDEPDVIVDAATLTGAQLVALGARTAGVMSPSDEVRTAVVDAAGRAGEAMWPMPLPEDLRSSLDSAVADIANIGDRNGGMLSAGLFLREFVAADQPWAHLDIAGPAWNEGQPYGYTPKGGTGAAVRTFVQLAEDVAAGRL